MIKNLALVVLGVALMLSFGMRSANRECPKTPYMDNGCVIQNTPTGNVRTCG